jgi:hypothetical protein
MPRDKQIGRASALECPSRRPRSPFAWGDGDLPLPQPVRSAMPAVKSRVSGECWLTSLGPDQKTRSKAGLAYPLRVLVVLMITVLFVSSARSDVYINAFLRAQAESVVLSEDKSIANVTITVVNSTAAPYSLVFLSAVLKDNRGYFFTPADRPTGIVTGRSNTCEVGMILEPGASLLIGLSFRVFPPLPPDTTTLRLSAEFQAQRHTCESFTVSLNDLNILN